MLYEVITAFWASIAMLFVVLTQDFFKALFRGEHAHIGQFREGVVAMYEGMISGARNMVPIGVATGVAGVVIGTVSLTGAHQVVGEFVEMLAGGNVMVMLLLVAVMSLIRNNFV